MLPEEMPDKIAALKVHCDRVGRDVNDVRIAVCPYAKPCDRDALKRYEDAGVDQVIMAAFVPGQAEMAAAIDTIAADLL